MPPEKNVEDIIGAAVRDATKVEVRTKAHVERIVRSALRDLLVHVGGEQASLKVDTHPDFFKAREVAECEAYNRSVDDCLAVIQKEIDKI